MTTLQQLLKQTVGVPGACTPFYAHVLAGIPTEARDACVDLLAQQAALAAEGITLPFTIAAPTAAPPYLTPGVAAEALDELRSALTSLSESATRPLYEGQAPELEGLKRIVANNALGPLNRGADVLAYALQLYALQLYATGGR